MCCLRLQEVNRDNRNDNALSLRLVFVSRCLLRWTLLFHRLRSHFFYLFLLFPCLSKLIQRVRHLPPKQNAGCSKGFECLISHWLTWRGGRTNGRLDGSDVITKPKFLASMHYQNLLPMVFRALAQSSAFIDEY